MLMKLRIFPKLLFVFLLISAIVVGLISGVTYFSISNGFASYLAQSELSTIDAVPDLLEKQYNEQGDWQKVFDDPHLMEKLCAINEQVHSGSLPEGRIPPEPPDARVPPLELRPSFPPFPPFPSFRRELFARIGVFDNTGKLLWGNERSGVSRASVILKRKGNPIGTLRLAPSESISRELENKFVKEQSRSLLFVCLFAFALAGLGATLLARHLVDAVNALVLGTRKLISGDLSTRIDLSRSDELGQLARDFNTLASTIEQHDRAHKQWITDTSHELRTPVAVLRAQVEAIQDGVQEANQKTLAVLHEEVMLLGKMIDDLHDLARYDVNQLKFRLLPCDLSAVLLESVESFEERFQRKNVKLDGSAIVSAPHVIVAGDAARLKQVFSNLLENSLRYTDEGGELKVSSFADSGFYSICFDDSNPGVPEELLLSIFERFYRVESSRSRMHGGSGLGLAICKSVIEGHHGTIKALPSPLGGLRVEIRLPLETEKLNGQR